MTQSNTTTTLANQECKPCSQGTPALKGEQLKSLAGQLGKDWKVVDEHHLEKNYTFDNFRSALDFTNRVGEIAEKQNHHPDIYLTWGKVGLKIWTHSVGGLSENDFVLAARADAAL